MPPPSPSFFFNDTATTEIYTLSLHDALPILLATFVLSGFWHGASWNYVLWGFFHGIDRKSTRLNSSHANISYAVFCLKKKKVLQLTAQHWKRAKHTYDAIARARKRRSTTGSS